MTSLFKKKLNLFNQQKHENWHFRIWPLQCDFFCNGIVTPISHVYFDQKVFFYYKTGVSSLVLIYMWVTYELIWTNCTALNWNFAEVFPVVNPIVNKNGCRYPKLRAINIFFKHMRSLYIETAEINL